MGKSRQEQINEIIETLKARREAKQGGAPKVEELPQIFPDNLAIDDGVDLSELADELAHMNHTVVYENGDIDQVDELETAVVYQLDEIKDTYDRAALVDFMLNSGLIDETEQMIAARVLARIGRGQFLSLRVLLSKAGLAEALAE